MSGSSSNKPKVLFSDDVAYTLGDELGRGITSRAYLARPGLIRDGSKVFYPGFSGSLDEVVVTYARSDRAGRRNRDSLRRGLSMHDNPDRDPAIRNIIRLVDYNDGEDPFGAFERGYPTLAQLFSPNGRPVPMGFSTTTRLLLPLAKGLIHLHSGSGRKRSLNDVKYTNIMMRYDSDTLAKLKSGRLDSHVKMYFKGVLSQVRDPTKRAQYELLLERELAGLKVKYHLFLYAVDKVEAAFTDFGQATEIDGFGDVTERIREPLGTPVNLSPQVVKALALGGRSLEKAYGDEADTWSFMVAYTLLATGHQPYPMVNTSRDPQTVLGQLCSLMLDRSFTPPFEDSILGRLDIPQTAAERKSGKLQAHLQGIFKRAFRPNVDDRWMLAQTVEELEKIVGEVPVPTSPHLDVTPPLINDEILDPFSPIPFLEAMRKKDFPTGRFDASKVSEGLPKGPETTRARRETKRLRDLRAP